MVLLSIITAVITGLFGAKLAFGVSKLGSLYRIACKVMSVFPKHQYIALLASIIMPFFWIFLIMYLFKSIASFIPSFIWFGFLSFIGCFAAALYYRARNTRLPSEIFAEKIDKNFY